MTRLSLILGVATLFGLAVLYLDGRALRAERDLLEARLATAEAEIDAHRHARAVHLAHLAREAARVADLEARLSELDDMEGGDAPLDPFLQRGADILWPD